MLSDKMATDVAIDEKIVAVEQQIVAEQNTSLSSRRIHQLTGKGQKIFIEKVDKLYNKLDKKWSDVKRVIDQVARCDNVDDLKSQQTNLCLVYGEYRLRARDLLEYLDDTYTDESIERKKQIEFVVTSCHTVYENVYTQIDLSIKNIQLETQSSVSSRSSRTKSSSKSKESHRSLQAKVRAKTALRRIETIEKEKELKKKQIDIDTELQVLEEEKVCDEAKIELEFYEETEDVDEESIIQRNIPVENKKERVNDYVNSLASRHTENVLNPEAREFVPVYDRDYIVTSELSKFLLRKDLMLSRLTKFDDKPENFSVWKSTFKSVVVELGVDARQELDLLIKWLGPDSTRYAVSQRASSSSNPDQGVQRLWDRLDERFGSPELVEISLRKKIENFPKLGYRDSKKLFDLADILDEIQNNMEDPKYRDLLACYNTSLGVNPIVNKLPHNIQEKWTSRASSYKKAKNVSFPPFAYFTSFVHDMSKIRNDPGFMYDVKYSSQPQTSKRMSTLKTEVYTPKPEMDELPHLATKKDSRSTTSNSVAGDRGDNQCQFHNVKGHTLNSCHTFKKKPLSVRKKFLKDKDICFKCCEQTTHRAINCTQQMTCYVCKGPHATALHVNVPFVAGSNGGETFESPKGPEKKKCEINSACVKLCGKVVGGKSCAKVVCVNVYHRNNPEHKIKMYALLDDQSNRSLAKPEFFNSFREHYEEIGFSLSSCAGKTDMHGRQAVDFVVENLDGTVLHDLPIITECSQIPDIREEIPTPNVARAYSHLNELAEDIPELDKDTQVLLLIGRDLAEAHHVLEQRIGPKGQPFAQRLGLGWVIIGETCLGKVHMPNSVCVNKTYIHGDNRGSIFPPCENRFFLKDRCDTLDQISQDVFLRTPEDDQKGMSAEDEEFLDIMKDGFIKLPDGKWSAPLPFRKSRAKLPNNRDQALKRANSLQASLKRNPEKQVHFIEFMNRIFANGYAEPAPPLQMQEECWYLPIFGVYHSKKKGQIRVVFDSAAQYQGVCLNSVLLQGPNLTNSLLGVLMRFRNHPVAVTADIEQMFFQFRVHEEHRNFLRFIWYKNNDPDAELTEYRMCSHVFGNSPSPSIASYGLLKTVAEMEPVYGPDVRDFVENNFYVDDGLASFLDTATAIDLVTRTQKALQQGGKLHLHKIASNDKDVMKLLPRVDLAKDLQDISIGAELLPTQRSLGMHWDLNTDCFTYTVSNEEKPYTRRGVLSTVNALYDPLGFVAPIVNEGRLLMRDLIHETVDWDHPLPVSITKHWGDWKDSLKELEQIRIARTYMPVYVASAKQEIHVFSDASEKAISAVAYMRGLDDDGQCHVGFVLGKSKVAPQTGHTIPRLELCAAVLAVELAESITKQLAFPIEEMNFYTDSRVVLGYLNNRVRRFYIYVQNRVSRILKSTNCHQWQFVSTNDNPADQGTRPIEVDMLQTSAWLNGPEFLKQSTLHTIPDSHELQSPEADREIRPEVKCMKTASMPSVDIKLDIFSGVKNWNLLIKVIALLKTKARCANGNNSMSPASRAGMLKESERLILKRVQQESFSQELECLLANQRLPRNSTILDLNPFIDKDGLLRVGGRLQQASDLSLSEKHPVILPKGHFVSRCVAIHYHETVRHQGFHLTEGAIRSAGFWIVGVKRLVRSLISHCVKCRKLRGKTSSQIMADLPEDRLSPGAPFSSVGVDVFGPWTVVTRRTRGGVSHNKRWAVLYTCLTTRAIHIEVIEEMSTSSFINATRRFMAIRGPVKIFRSDRGTNFVGATGCMKISAINVEDQQMRNFMDSNQTMWVFNSPHSSHMGGVWERLIGIVRRILDSMLADLTRDLSHEVLTTFMAEICSIVNSRPLVKVSTDPDEPTVLSPAMLLTQKPADEEQCLSEIDVKDMYRAQWRRVQCLSNIFWKKWKSEYLQTLQRRGRWPVAQRDFRIGDIVLMQDDTPRNSWPMGVITELFPSKDGHVRKVTVKISRAGEADSKYFVRHITKLVPLLEANDKSECVKYDCDHVDQ